MSKRYISRIIFVIAMLTQFSYSSKAQTIREGYTLTNTQLAAFKAQSKNVVKELSRHISSIADKTIEKPTRNKYILNALKLFRSPNENTVEVTSTKSNDVIGRPTITQYLYRLRDLHYTHVSITWYEITVSDFVHGTDGNYYATASIFQKFDGTWENGEVRGSNNDIKQKTVEISLVKVNRTYEGGNRVEDWDLKLGDIKVDVYPNDLKSHND